MINQLHETIRITTQVECLNKRRLCRLVSFQTPGEAAVFLLHHGNVLVLCASPRTHFPWNSTWRVSFCKLCGRPHTRKQPAALIDFTFVIFWRTILNPRRCLLVFPHWRIFVHFPSGRCSSVPARVLHCATSGVQVRANSSTPSTASGSVV